MWELGDTHFEADYPYLCRLRVNAVVDIKIHPVLLDGIGTARTLNTMSNW